MRIFCRVKTNFNFGAPKSFQTLFVIHVLIYKNKLQCREFHHLLHKKISDSVVSTSKKNANMKKNTDNNNNNKNQYNWIAMVDPQSDNKDLQTINIYAKHAKCIARHSDKLSCLLFFDKKYYEKQAAQKICLYSISNLVSLTVKSKAFPQRAYQLKLVVCCLQYLGPPPKLDYQSDDEQ